MYVVQATFGEQLLGVQQVDQVDTSASVETVNSHLDMLRPAIQGYSGSVEVLAVKDGICEVKYTGPAHWHGHSGRNQGQISRHQGR